VDDGGEFYCLDTTYYIAPNNEDLAWFITGVLNSDLAQFYIRRNAATYRGNYLRYKSEYVGDIPIPDPESENVEDELVESIATTARQMQDLISEYRRAETLLANSSELLDAASVDKVDITRTAYITRIPDSDEANDTDIQPSREGSSVRLNVHQSVDLDDEDTAKSFIDLLDALNVTSLSDLFDADYPRTRDGMERVLDVARDSTETTDEAGKRLKTVEDSLHDDVYEVFKLSSDHKELVEDRVLVPENPLKSKVR